MSAATFDRAWARAVRIFRWAGTAFVSYRIASRDDWLLGVVLFLIAVALEIESAQVEAQRKALIHLTNATQAIATMLGITNRTGQEATSTTEEAKDARQQRKQK